MTSSQHLNQHSTSSQSHNHLQPAYNGLNQQQTGYSGFGHHVPAHADPDRTHQLVQEHGLNDGVEPAAIRSSFAIGVGICQLVCLLASVVVSSRSL